MTDARDRAHADHRAGKSLGPPTQARRCDALVRRQASPHALVREGIGAFVVAYALSPIDLIPDFFPVLGYLDDVILLPTLIWATVRMLPPTCWRSCVRGPRNG